MRWLKILLPLLVMFVTIQAMSDEITRKRVIELTNNPLPYPKHLCPNISPIMYIKDKNIYTDHKNQILLGILIENYSGMTLKKPQFFPKKHGVINEPIPVDEIIPRRSEFFIFQNPNNEVSGSVSWEIFQGITHTNQRMVVTFEVPWR